MQKFWVLMICLLIFPIWLVAESKNSNPTETLANSLVQSVLQQTNSTQQSDIEKANLSIKTPIAPEIPLEQKKSPVSGKKTEIEPIAGTIFINEKQYFTGLILIPNFTVQIKHKLQEQDFIKELPRSQIHTITCVEWSPTAYRNTQNTFQFACSLYNITDSKGNHFTYNQPIAALQKILFQSEAGSTLFYSYFIDYLVKQKWTNLNTEYSLMPISIPLTSVVRTIQFGSFDIKSIPKNFKAKIPEINENSEPITEKKNHTTTNDSQKQPLKDMKINSPSAKPQSKNKQKKILPKKTKKKTPTTKSVEKKPIPNPIKKKTPPNPPVQEKPSAIKEETIDEKQQIRSRR